jgi:SAM-dependent methyltransferase
VVPGPDPAVPGPFDPRLVPTPPVDRWELPDEDDPAVYLDSGSFNVQTMASALPEAGLDLHGTLRVLDFGCGYGRMTRWLPEPEDGGEAWGVDLDAERIAWARQHLSPPFRFATTSAQPHLPFVDDRFDLVCACSAFPHIAEQGDTWILELGRVTRPGGLVYATVYDEHTLGLVLAGRGSPKLATALWELDAADGVLGTDWDVIALSRRPGSGQLFTSRRWLERTWGQWFDLVTFVPEAFHLQTAVVLRAR